MPRGESESKLHGEKSLIWRRVWRERAVCRGGTRGKRDAPVRSDALSHRGARADASAKRRVLEGNDLQVIAGDFVQVTVGRTDARQVRVEVKLGGRQFGSCISSWMDSRA